jgi:hypothetical protein
MLFGDSNSSVSTASLRQQCRDDPQASSSATGGGAHALVESCLFASDREMRQCDVGILYMAPLKVRPSIVEVAPIAATESPLELYAIRATGTGLFKVGIAKQPESRPQDLQVGSPLGPVAREHSYVDRRPPRLRPSSPKLRSVERPEVE